MMYRNSKAEIFLYILIVCTGVLHGWNIGSCPDCNRNCPTPPKCPDIPKCPDCKPNLTCPEPLKCPDCTLRCPDMPTCPNVTACPDCHLNVTYPVSNVSECPIPNDTLAEKILDLYREPRPCNCTCNCDNTVHLPPQERLVCNDTAALPSHTTVSGWWNGFAIGITVGGLFALAISMMLRSYLDKNKTKTGDDGFSHQHNDKPECQQRSYNFQAFYESVRNGSSRAYKSFMSNFHTPVNSSPYNDYEPLLESPDKEGTTSTLQGKIDEDLCAQEFTNSSWSPLPSNVHNKDNIVHRESVQGFPWEVDLSSYRAKAVCVSMNGGGCAELTPEETNVPSNTTKEL